MNNWMISVQWSHKQYCVLVSERMLNWIESVDVNKMRRNSNMKQIQCFDWIVYTNIRVCRIQTFWNFKFHVNSAVFCWTLFFWLYSIIIMIIILGDILLFLLFRVKLAYDIFNSSYKSTNFSPTHKTNLSILQNIIIRFGLMNLAHNVIYSILNSSHKTRVMFYSLIHEDVIIGAQIE